MNKPTEQGDMTMRKLVFFVFISIILFFTFPAIGETLTQNEDEEFQVIPDEAIRLRILANSDDESDQDIKHLVRDEVNKEITTWVETMTDIDEARDRIQNGIPEIETIVDEVLHEEGKSRDYQVEYGENVTFPTKVYGDFLYPAGEYEAVLITLGEGEGANWWCVLFPPLCFLDFDNGTSVAQADEEPDQKEEKEDDEVEVKFFLFDWLGWS